MSKANETLLARWFEEVWNQGKLSTVDELMASDCIGHGLGPEPIIGPPGFKPFFQQIKSAFPDIKISCKQFVSDGDLVAARWTATMVHEGHFLGRDRTGKRVNTDGMCICRMRNDQIAEAWNNWDLHGVMQQIT